MTALVQFLYTYAVWIYITGVVIILYGVKMMLDARHAARTTIFALEQEQAQEESYRAVVIMLFAALLIGGVSAVNTFVYPDAPKSEPPAPKPTAAITRVITLPTFTAVPSFTPELPTSTPTVQPTRTPIVAVPVTTVPLPPTAPPVVSPPTATRPAQSPAPEPVEPTDGQKETGANKANNALTFRWTWCDGCFNAQTDAYLVVVTYVDRTTGQPKSVQGRAGSSAVLRLADILGGYSDSEQIYQKAVDNRYTWTVTVLRNGVEITPRSRTMTFLWF